MRYKKRTASISLFSLIELIAAIAVLAILILASMQFFSSSQNVILSSESVRVPAEDARIALDMISRDFENAYYGNGSAPFWHWHPASRPASWGQFRNEIAAFVSITPVPPSNCVSKLCEIKYQLYFASSHNSEEGWLLRSVTGDRNQDGSINTKWNFFNNLTASYGKASSAFTADAASSDDYQKLIPHVTNFNIDCYYVLNAPISPDTAVSTTADLNPTPFPYSVVITLSLLDKSSWDKWIELQGTSVYPESETSAANTLRMNRQQTFTRTVFIGDRGQN